MSDLIPHHWFMAIVRTAYLGHGTEEGMRAAYRYLTTQVVRYHRTRDTMTTAECHVVEWYGAYDEILAPIFHRIVRPAYYALD